MKNSGEKQNPRVAWALTKSRDEDVQKVRVGPPLGTRLLGGP